MDAAKETDTLTDTPTEEPFLGPLDIVLLVFLLVGAVWWLLSNRKREQASQVKSYSIQ